jgi:ComF family protein
MLNNLINLFYPKVCLLCKKTLVKGEEFLCIDCLSDLPRTNYSKYKVNPVKDLFAGYSCISEISPFLFFEKEGDTQRIIHSIKYYGNRKLAEFMGRLAALELSSSGFFDDIDVIIPVPLHYKKERKRGFNQSECISRGISSVCNCKIDAQSLIRTVHTKSQTRKSLYERHVNVEKIFQVVDSDALTGKHILLVDDVITTGATTSACIDALLLEALDITISIFSLAVVSEI